MTAPLPGTAAIDALASKRLEAGGSSAMGETALDHEREGDGTIEPTAETGRTLRVGFARIRDGHGFTIALPEPEHIVVTPCAIPLRVAQLLAFAHETEHRIAEDEIADRAAAAREFGVTRARITQILDLLLLAPDIQEEILTIEVEPGYNPINEHALRWIVRARDWPTQRTRWRELNTI
jgi:hypothetical protein